MDLGKVATFLGRELSSAAPTPVPSCPKGSPDFQPGLLAAQALCSQQRVSHGNVMTRPRQGSQNRQAAGRGACLPSVSPAVWTRTFLSISASVLSLLRDRHSTQLKCLLPSPERMWRSRVFCSGSRTSGLRGSGEKNAFLPAFS